MTRIQPEDRGEVVMYRTENGRTALDVRLAGETVWLTQARMVDLFGRERSVVTKHVGNVFAEGELKEKGNVQKMHIANSDKPVAFYSLDVIISPISVDFRDTVAEIGDNRSYPLVRRAPAATLVVAPGGACAAG